MKIIKYTILACALSLSSCGKSFLEVEPIGQLGAEQMFQDVQGMSDALIGSYRLAGDYFESEYSIYGDLRADDVIRNTVTGSNLLLNEYNYSYDQENVGPTLGLWREGYAAINNINNVINAADPIRDKGGVDLARIKMIEGEAHILRGLMFFALSNIYAQHYTYTADASHLGIPIPLVTPKPGVKMSRASMKATYEQIISDLKFGIEALGSTKKERVFASADAAKALLSRIYLYMGDYDNSIKYATEVLDGGKYPLAKPSEYMDMFRATAQRKDFSSINAEVIWQFNLTKLRPNSINIFYFGVESIGAVRPSYIDLFDDQDIRKSMFGFDERSKSYLSLKYAQYDGVVEANVPIVFKVVRSSEMFLNRAEAYFHSKQYDLAVADIKQIRARAYNVSPQSVTISYTSPDELLQQIKLERRKELGFEGQRIFDIMRYKESLDRGTGCTSPVCKLSYPNDLFIMPIPKRELDANDLIIPNPTVNN
ncbi:SusD family protein [Sphingobacterium nematocida]|uniref:SusD family protein n=1 Tax=Sphingobacterium nematocida TaxID=1513896 RepID=A0A1T5B249_9SPHI|nr:RagB/SusD family nutrient uptake outer membrane protein [Sphingobacterium nematocida]SKB40953.1 SusD family protein [Sphingobacterium nematocida]